MKTNMPSADIPQIDLLVRDALAAFTDDFTSSQWWGKEHDCVNRFVHGFLFPQGFKSSVFSNATQIGIEVGVATPPGVGTRDAARKDVVIWPAPWMSCWNSEWQPVNHPVAVMEWKLVRTRGSLKCHPYDRKWLSAFAQWRPGFVGYSITLNRQRGEKERICVTRFHQDRVDEGWLRL